MVSNYLGENTLAMELATCKEQGSPMHEEIMIGVVTQVVLALQHLHAHHIIHRNVYPEFIILCEDHHRIKLTGFDNAVAVHGNESCGSFSIPVVQISCYLSIM